MGLQQHYVHVAVGTTCRVGYQANEDGVTEYPVLGFMDKAGHELFFSLTQDQMIALMDQMCTVAEHIYEGKPLPDCDCDEQ